MGDGASAILDAFLETSWPSVVHLAHHFNRARPRPDSVRMFRFRGATRETVVVPPGAFLLRTSFEYANPQVTLEELQGVVLARLLEVGGAYARDHPGAPPPPADRPELLAKLAEPPTGPVVPFVLNVDDIEPDRYSVNPLRASLVSTGQSGRAVASVTTEGLGIDPAFVDKYRGSLVGDRDLHLVEEELGSAGTIPYVDFVDRIKYRQLGALGSTLGIDLAIPAFRMPLDTLATEGPAGSVHAMVRAAHRDLATLRRLYELFGREFGRRKTLLPAVPHLADGVASKRLARGKVTVDASRITQLDVRYASGPLYPNEVDRADVAVAHGDGSGTFEPERFTNFDFHRTPASPQFALYMVASPEDGAIWHGVGKYAGVQIVQSYTAFHRAAASEALFGDVPLAGRYDPPQWDLVADGMLNHPTWHNIDASALLVEDLPARLPRHVRLRPLEVDHRPGAPEADPSA